MSLDFPMRYPCDSCPENDVCDIDKKFTCEIHEEYMGYMGIIEQSGLRCRDFFDDDEEDELEKELENLPVVRCKVCNELVRADELIEGRYCPMCFEDLSNLVDEALADMKE